MSLMVNNLWIRVATSMVFLVHLGFACLESGLTRAKSTINTFSRMSESWRWASPEAPVGFGLMRPGGFWLVPGWLGFAVMVLNDPEPRSAAGLTSPSTAWGRAPAFR